MAHPERSRVIQTEINSSQTDLSLLKLPFFLSGPEFLPQHFRALKTRVDAGTDVAMIGAWDTSRNDSVLVRVPFKQIMNTLHEDVEAGHLFLIHTGADGGGPIDVYVEEPIPESALKQTRRAQGEFLIRVPSGRLVVGGAEDYRAPKPRITGENSIVVLPAGDYRLGCHIGTEDEWVPETPSRAELEKVLGVDDYRYWRKLENTGRLGCLSVLLFPLLAFPLGWKAALGITLVFTLSWFYVRETFFLKRNARYQRIDKAVKEIWKRAQDAAPPTFVLELSRVPPGSDLKGGEIKV